MRCEFNSSSRACESVMGCTEKSPFGRKLMPVNTAVGGADLVLRADRLLEDFLFQANAFGGQLIFADQLALQGIEGVEQADGERANSSPCRCAPAGRRRDGSRCRGPSSGSATSRAPMGARFPRPSGNLDDRIHHPDAVLEERRQVAAGQVAVFVDGGGQHRSRHAGDTRPDNPCRPQKRRCDMAFC